MRELRNNVQLRERPAAQAKLSAEDYLTKAAKGQWLNELQNFWRNQAHLPQALEKFSRLK